MKILFCKSSKTPITKDIFFKELFLLSSILKKKNNKKQFEIIPMEDNPIAGDFSNKLIQNNPNILHFSGEMFVDSHNIKGIYFKGRYGNDIVMDVKKWDAFFHGLKKMGDIIISSMVLSVFGSNKIAKTISRYGVYCIAFSKGADTNLKIPFINGFYFALAGGYPTERAFEMGKLSWICEFQGETRPDLKQKVDKIFTLYYNGHKIR